MTIPSIVSADDYSSIVSCGLLLCPMANLTDQSMFASFSFYCTPQDPADVGLTGLIWLFLSYGYVLYFASNLIGEGSELLLLVPSMAGLVGGVVLPVLGAVPDGGT
jgi:hypothetical protein